jgi:hypothetical protein
VHFSQFHSIQPHVEPLAHTSHVSHPFKILQESVEDQCNIKACRNIPLDFPLTHWRAEVTGDMNTTHSDVQSVSITPTQWIIRFLWLSEWAMFRPCLSTSSREQSLCRRCRVTTRISEKDFLISEDIYSCYVPVKLMEEMVHIMARDKFCMKCVSSVSLSEYPVWRRDRIPPP